MALIAMTTADTVEYVSDRDPCKRKTKVFKDPEVPSKGFDMKTEILEGATKFTLRPLDVFLMGHIYDNASQLTGKEGSNEIGINTRINQTNIDAVRHGLCGIVNFADKNGDQMSFKSQKTHVNGRPYEVVHDDILNTLGIKLIGELADEIKRISEVTPDEEKNSEGALQPSG